MTSAPERLKQNGLLNPRIELTPTSAVNWRLSMDPPPFATFEAKIAGCGFAITSIQRLHCRISMNTTFRSKKLKPFSIARCKTYADERILESRSARLMKEDT